MRILLRAVLALCLLCSPALSRAQRTHILNQKIDSLFPDQPAGFLTDAAHLVKNPNAVNARLMAIEVQDRLSLRVVTLPNIGNYEADRVALEIGRKWLVATSNDSLGNPVRHTGGVILFVPTSPGHGHCRVEVATGSEGYVTDSRAADACRKAAPLFNSLDYDGALLSIANDFDGYHKEVVPVAVSSSAEVPQPSWPSAVIMIVGFAIIVVVLIVWGIVALFGGGEDESDNSFNYIRSDPSPYRPTASTSRRSSESDDTPSSSPSPSFDFGSSSSSSSGGDSGGSSFGGGSDSFSGGGGGADV